MERYEKAKARFDEVTEDIGADGPITIDDTACVAKSFPEFFEVFQNK